MSKKSECYKCKVPIDWELLVWDISAAKGYKSKIYVCACGHQQSLHVPVTKELIAHWKMILSEQRAREGYEGVLD